MTMRPRRSATSSGSTVEGGTGDDWDLGAVLRRDGVRADEGRRRLVAAAAGEQPWQEEQCGDGEGGPSAHVAMLIRPSAGGCPCTVGAFSG